MSTNDYDTWNIWHSSTGEPVYVSSVMSSGPYTSGTSISISSSGLGGTGGTIYKGGSSTLPYYHIYQGPTTNPEISYLMTSDLHFTDKLEDAYRFGIFEQLLTLLEEIKESGAGKETNLLILGDILDAKDRHPSRLINKVLEGLMKLSEKADEIYILMGNHDYIDDGTPYFKFLNYFPSSNITYVTEPLLVHNVGGPKMLFLPHSRSPVNYFSNSTVEEWELHKVDFLFMHQTFSGAVSESGRELEGFPPALPRLFGYPGRIFSGDIHAPQSNDNYTYVGSPYHVHFGDKYQPRILELNVTMGMDGTVTDQKVTNHGTKFPKRHMLSIRDAGEIEDKVFVGDQVKIRLNLAKEDLVDWSSHRERVLETCRKCRVEVFGIEIQRNDSLDAGPEESEASVEVVGDPSPSEALESFLLREDPPSHIADFGKKLVGSLV